MLIKKWAKIPDELKNDSVFEFYKLLRKKNFSLFFKRTFDIFTSAIMLVGLLPVFVILAFAIKLESRGSVFFKQERVTQYGRRFKVFKFRTMVKDAESRGAQITQAGDKRITRVGRAIRKCRLDELPQLLNVLGGSMSFVGTRPEVVKYVEKYTDKMKATLLLPAGITSPASIKFKDEDELLQDAENIDEAYVQKVLPLKMEYNYTYLEKCGFWRDIGVMFQTVFAVIKR